MKEKTKRRPSGEKKWQKKRRQTMRNILKRKCA